VAVPHVSGKGSSHLPPKRSAAEAASDESEPETHEERIRRKARANVSIIQRSDSATRKPIPMPKSRFENANEARETETAEVGDKRSARKAGSGRNDPHKKAKGKLDANRSRHTSSSKRSTSSRAESSSDSEDERRKPCEHTENYGDDAMGKGTIHLSDKSNRVV
jgi:hypothetical protein